MATILRVRFTYNLGPVGSSIALFQTYWRPGTSPGSTADATDCLARVRAALNGCVALVVGVYRPQTAVDALDDATGAITGTFTGAAPANVTGSDSGDPMPAQTAWVIRARTNLIVGPRLLKGRMFLGGTTEGHNAPAGTPVSGDVATIDAAMNGMLTGGATASFPVIWHRPDPTAAIPVGTSGPVVSFQTQPDYWGSQRGRRF
jgi:hypothetical protein